MMGSFAELLRLYRQRSREPGTGRPLSQMKLGQLLGEELGTAGYSGAAVSDWERNRSQVHKDQRRVLVALIRVLYRYKGLATPSEADSLLLAGHYRTLNEVEKLSIFPELPQADVPPSDSLEHSPEFIARGLSYFLKTQARKLRDYFGSDQEDWSGRLLELLGRSTGRWSAERVLRALLWTLVLLITWKMALPLLSWPYRDHFQARAAIVAFAGATIILPLLVAALTDTRHKEFWKSRNLVNSPLLRFYTHLGASLGFHVGYFTLLAVNLVWYYWLLDPVPRWINLILTAWPLILSAAAARQTPINIILAYGDLQLRHAGVVSVSFLLGIAWGIYFYNFYPYILSPSFGPLLLLVLLVILIGKSIRKTRPTKSTLPGT